MDDWSSIPGRGRELFLSPPRTDQFSLRLNWRRHEAERSLPSSAEIKNAWSYTSTPLNPFDVFCVVNPYSDVLDTTDSDVRAVSIFRITHIDNLDVFIYITDTTGLPVQIKKLLLL
jgi:hypothetical protein